MNRKEFAKQALFASAMMATPTGAAGLTKKDLPSSASNNITFKKLFNGEDLTGFVDVNTSSDTWWVEDNLLKCTGLPIGVMRTEKQYENFVLDIEWRFMEEGGNSGVFILADGTPHEDTPFPRGMEVQMLDPEWAVINDRPVEYVHGHLFPVMGLEGTVPDNPSNVVPGRSNALEDRMNKMGEWNRYIISCIDGNIKLSVNGKFVNGIQSTQRKKGYICPESEGAEIHFRKIDIMELPGGVITPDQAAVELE
ncbi:MAG: DUF1080 domain-containing protein [Balneolales bacterium]